MRRLGRSFALLVAITAAMQWAGTAVHAQDMLVPFGESAGNWNYLYTVDSFNLAADPTVPTIQNGSNPFLSETFAFWAHPDYSTALPVPAQEVDAPNSIVSLNWQSGLAPFSWSGVTAINTYRTTTGETGTILTAPPSGQRRTQYFRKEFTTTEDIESMLLSGTIDDGAVIFIDGQEVGRIGRDMATTGAFSATLPPYTEFTTTDADEGATLTVPLDLRYFTNSTLEPGNHVLGIAVHSVNLTSSDMGMHVQLTAQVGENQLATDASGSWTDSTNWTFQTPPNAAGAEALMRNDAAGSIYYNSAFIIGTLDMNNTNGYTLIGLGTMTLDNTPNGNAVINVGGGAHDIQIETELLSPTDMTVAAGASITFNNDVITNGNALTKTGAGTVTFNNYVEGNVSLAAGGATGNGAISGDLANNSGVVSPGDGVGPMQIGGDYNQGEMGTLSIQIASDDQYDVLDVEGMLNADGRLSVSLLNSYDPAVGTSFNILNFSGFNGQFSSMDLPQLSNGKVWDASALSVTGALSVVPEPGTFLMSGLAALLFGLARRRR